MDTKESVGQESKESLKETTVSAVEETVSVSEVEAVSSVSGTDHNNETTAMSTLPSGKPARGMCVRRVWKVIKTILIILLVGYVILGISRIPHVLEERKTAEVVAQIHATKLTMDDVMGTNLPPDPGAEADKTIAGVDANKNGIRDDVELAIFRDYASSSRKRSSFLQFALAQQTMMTLVLVRPETVTAIIEDLHSRANVCLWSLHAELRVPYDNNFNDSRSGELGEKARAMWNQYIELTDADEKYLNDLQFNSASRTSAYKAILNGNLRSYEVSRGGCDIDPSTLPD